jgi:predicted glutamine amidotransferase
MCGLFGWQFKKKSGVSCARREVMAGVLALNNSRRGDQSWGVVLKEGKGKGKFTTIKEVGDIADVVGVSAWGHAAQAMAHTRYSTHGKIVKDNCHPFRAGKILLAHNGVIFNHEDLNKKYGRKCEVDSQHFASHLDEGKDFDDIEAYGALEWLEDDEPDKVFLSRMSGGSLAIARILESNLAQAKQVGVVWSSNEAHLKEALTASGLPHDIYKDLEEGEICSVMHGRLWTETKRKRLILAERTYTYSGGRSMQEWTGMTSGGWTHGGKSSEPWGHIYRGWEPDEDTAITFHGDAQTLLKAYAKESGSAVRDALHDMALKNGWRHSGGEVYVKDGKVWTLDEIEDAIWDSRTIEEAEIQGLVDFPEETTK